METLQDFDPEKLDEFRLKIHQQEHNPKGILLKNKKIHKEVQRILREGRAKTQNPEDKHPLKARLAWIFTGSTILGILIGAFTIKDTPIIEFTVEDPKPARLQNLPVNPCIDYMKQVSYTSPRVVGWMIACRQFYPKSIRIP